MDRDTAAVKLQALFRGVLHRRNTLPLALILLQKALRNNPITISTAHEDGRVNSSLDQISAMERIKQTLAEHRISEPDMRAFFDVAIRDYRHGWLPINIKTTSTTTSDNTGNMAMCLHAYMDIDVLAEAHDGGFDCRNGPCSQLFWEMFGNRQFNRSKKDYYFLVVNKTNPSDVIINSVRGLSVLTPNINNPPFQIRWSMNREFRYRPINDCITMFVRAIQTPNPSWQEIFYSRFRRVDPVTLEVLPND